MKQSYKMSPSYYKKRYDKRQIHVDIGEDNKIWVKTEARRRGTTVSAVMRAMINKFLELGLQSHLEVPPLKKQQYYLVKEEQHMVRSRKTES